MKDLGNKIPLENKQLEVFSYWADTEIVVNCYNTEANIFPKITLFGNFVQKSRWNKATAWLHGPFLILKKMTPFYFATYLFSPLLEVHNKSSEVLLNNT